MFIGVKLSSRQRQSTSHLHVSKPEAGPPIAICKKIGSMGVSADERKHKSFLVIDLAGSGIYGACVLLGDSLFYTSVLTFYQPLLLLCIIPGIAGLFFRIWKPNQEQTVAFYDTAVFFLSAVADIVMYLDIFGETETNLPVSEASMLIFAVAQTFYLYLMNNRVLMKTKEAEQTLAR